MSKKNLLMFTLLFGVTAFAAPIKKIEVINNMGVPKEVIISSIEMKEGAEFSQDKSAQDINRLKAMKYFNDVNIQTKDVEDGVEVYIDVKEKENVNDLLKKDGLLVSNDTIPMDTKSFTVSNIRITGLKNISRSEFLDLANIKEGSVVNERKLIDVKARIASSGYFRSADIKVKEGQTLEIVVLENPIIKDVIVEGGSLYTGDQIKSLLGIEAGKILNLNDLKEAGEKVKALYNKDGFVLCGISDVYTDEAGVLHIKVTEGIVRKIEAKKMITIQKGARRKPNDDKLKTADHVIDREVVIQKDRIFNIKDFDQTANNLMRLGIFRNIKYEARGIEGDPNGVVITLLIDEDRTASIQGGISYGTESGLMGSASVKDTNWAGKNQEVEFSIEKSTKTGAKINISFFDPWIKGTDRVSWGWGAYKRTYGNPSTVFNTTKVLGGRLNIGKGVNRNLSFNIGAKSEYLQEFPNSEIFQHVSADGKAIVEVPDKDQSFNKKFYDLKDKLTENIGQQPNEKIKENITKMIETLNDENKRQEIENNLNPDDLKENIQKIKEKNKGKIKIENIPKHPKKLVTIEGLNDKYYLFSIHPYIIYDTRNHPYQPTSGKYARIQVEGGYASGYNAGFFASANADLRLYHKGLFENNSFAYRLQAGWMTQNTKEAQKYWVGGGNSLRGYDSGDFRGNKQLVFTVENRTQVNDLFGFVLFTDIGRAWDYSIPGYPNGRDFPFYERNDTEKYGQLAYGVGIGARFNTPIGPLRFDLGWPIGKRWEDEQDKNKEKSKFGNMKFYFNMGHSF